MRAGGIIAIKNANHRDAIETAQDFVIALVIYAGTDLEDKLAVDNLKRSKRELDKAFKQLLKE